MVLPISRNTNLDITLLTHWIHYILVLWKLSLHFFSTLRKLYYFTQSPYDWFKKYQWYHYVFEWKWPTSCYIVRKQEFWQHHECKYTNCDYQINQSLWKTWSTSFLTIIKTILIPSSIPFLNFLIKESIVLQVGFLPIFLTLLFTNTSKVSFLYCFVLKIYLYFILMSNCYENINLIYLKWGKSEAKYMPLNQYDKTAY